MYVYFRTIMTFFHENYKFSYVMWKKNVLYNNNNDDYYI